MEPEPGSYDHRTTSGSNNLVAHVQNGEESTNNTDILGFDTDNVLSRSQVVHLAHSDVMSPILGFNPRFAGDLDRLTTTKRQLTPITYLLDGQFSALNSRTLVHPAAVCSAGAHKGNDTKLSQVYFMETLAGAEAFTLS